ncbi:MAG: hypothetical protein U1C97_00430 [Candidatus Gracilibacteria bacterium]|nr:hypothetical protein [Candidatus Gracilibacteria bacterium]
MRQRTAVERAIKRIKLDFSSERLTRRGNPAFQAHLDRSLIAFHLMLRLEGRGTSPTRGSWPSSGVNPCSGIGDITSKLRTCTRAAQHQTISLAILHASES